MSNPKALRSPLIRFLRCLNAMRDGAPPIRLGVRCDAVMLDAEAAPLAAGADCFSGYLSSGCIGGCMERFKALPFAWSRSRKPLHRRKQPEETPEPHRPDAPMDTASGVMEDGEALRRVLARLADQPGSKKLDQSATPTAARELSMPFISTVIGRSHPDSRPASRPSMGTLWGGAASVMLAALRLAVWDRQLGDFILQILDAGQQLVDCARSLRRRSSAASS